MNKKYILTDETKEVRGHILHRIQAVQNFGNVKAGDLGGWIEKEENLNHNGNCWIYNDAMVYENARIYSHAMIFGDSEIYGNASVSGNTLIFENATIHGCAKIRENVEIRGNANIYGNAEVYGSAKISNNADIKRSRNYLCIGPIGSRNDYTTFYRTKDNDIWVCCGCFNGSVEEFKFQVNKTHGDNIFTKEYQIAISAASSIIQLIFS